MQAAAVLLLATVRSCLLEEEAAGKTVLPPNGLAESLAPTAWLWEIQTLTWCASRSSKLSKRCTACFARSPEQWDNQGSGAV